MDHKQKYKEKKAILHNLLPKHIYKLVMELVEHYYCYKEPLSRYEILVEKAYRNAGKAFNLGDFLSKEEARELHAEERRMDELSTGYTPPNISISDLIGQSQVVANSPQG